MRGCYAMGYGILSGPAGWGAGNGVGFQEVDFVLDRGVVVTVRKTPEGCKPFEADDVLDEGPAGEIAASLADAVAEQY